MKLQPAEYTQSCDWCRHQEGRHYCLLHGRQVKNMDAVRCDDWSDKEKPLSQKNGKKSTN